MKNKEVTAPKIFHNTPGINLIGMSSQFSPKF
jgi:hypothetical protein